MVRALCRFDCIVDCIALSWLRNSTPGSWRTKKKRGGAGEDEVERCRKSSQEILWISGDVLFPYKMLFHLSDHVQAASLLAAFHSPTCNG